jgi:hypothetical protein
VRAEHVTWWLAGGDREGGKGEGTAVTGEDDLLAELRRRFPAWQVWFVRSSVAKGGTWCANPWAKEKDRTGVLHADKAAHLVEYIIDYEAEFGRQVIPAGFPALP